MAAPLQQAVAERTGALAPQAGVPHPTVGLPARMAGHGTWVLGVHGGAGESTLADALALSQAGHAWPASQTSTTRVLLVARLDGRGVNAAQEAVKQWAAGLVPGVQVVGIVWSADCPRRAAKPVRDRASVIAGGVPQAWSLPWVELWRLGAGAPFEQLPGPVQKTLQKIRSVMQEAGN